MRNFENVETLRQQDLTAQFENIFLGGNRHLDEDSVDEAEEISSSEFSPVDEE
jgi:hypothetical protein